MNVQHPLTDEAIRAAIARRATSGGDDGLRERVLTAAAAVSQRRGWRVRAEGALGDPARRSTLMLAAAVLLLLAMAIGAAVVGNLIDRTTPAPLGGIAYLFEGDLYVAGPDGESPRLVWDVPASEDLAPAHLVWLDPTTVLMELYSGAESGVHVVNVETGVHRLLDAGGYVALSPDRRLVAVHAVGEGATPPERVRLIDISSGAIAGEIPGLIGGYPAMWSPDGRSILGESPETVERVDIASGARTVLAAGLCCGLSPHYPTWSPDGTRVVYVTYHEPVARDCEFRCGTLWAVAAAGGEPTRLTPEVGSEILPAISPDGRWIAYLEEDTSRLIVIAADGSGRRVIALASPQFRWDPDAAGLTYLGPGGTLWHITLTGVVTQIEAPAVSEFARQVLP